MPTWQTTAAEAMHHRSQAITISFFFLPPGESFPCRLQTRFSGLTTKYDDGTALLFNNQRLPVFLECSHLRHLLRRVFLLPIQNTHKRARDDSVVDVEHCRCSWSYAERIFGSDKGLPGGSSCGEVISCNEHVLVLSCLAGRRASHNLSLLVACPRGGVRRGCSQRDKTLKCAERRQGKQS